MRRINKLLAFAASLLLSTPAFAGWGTPAVVSSTAVSATHLCSSGVRTVAPNTLIIMAGGAVTNATADAMVVSDDAGTGMVWTTYTSYRTTTIQAAFISWAFSAAGYTGKSVTVGDTATGATNFAQVACSLITVTGGKSEDTAARGAGAGTATTSPTVTSGTPAKSGDFFIVSYQSPNNITNTYTEDGTWTNLVNKNGNANITNSIAYLINSGVGTKTHAPTTASQAYTQEIMGLALSDGSLTLLGVS